MMHWNGEPEQPRLESLQVGDTLFHRGDRVCLRPRAGGDVFDLALRGKTAIIEAIEQDFEDRVYLSVTIEDDPGRDFGIDGKPGHRFFFSPEEVELLGPQREGDRS